MTASVDKHAFDDKIELKELRVAHRDLDVSIARLATRADIDQLQVRRMKKRKLQIKDLIVRLESELIPNLNA
jgi:hypothetical protein